MLSPKVSPSTLMFLPEASCRPLSAWQARQSACAIILMGTRAINNRGKPPIQNANEAGYLAPFRNPHPSPELLRSRFVCLFNITGDEATEEAVSAALLILASSFSRRPGVIAGLCGTHVL